MATQRITARRRRLSVESLEKRQMLAAHINELMVDPLFTSGNGRQYIELRGEPNATLPGGSYLAVISERGIGSINPGVIHGIFDLSNQRFGSNGMLVILPQDSPYPMGAGLEDSGPQPNVLQSTRPGFGGLPGNLYTDMHTSTDAIDFILGANGYFLFQSDTPPILGEDLDGNNNGVFDEDSPALEWNVMDSISLHPFVFGGPVAYGQIVYIENAPGDPREVLTQSEDTVIVRGPGFGYAARIGDSIGSEPDDWAFSTVRNMATGNAPPRYRMEKGIFGTPIPREYLGRDLDHLGESNFIGGVRGTVVEKILGENDEQQLVPVSGVQILADTNENGVRDVLNYEADPDQFPVDTELTNLYTGVTLSTVGSDGRSIGFDIESHAENFRDELGNRVFAHSGIDWFYNERRLRIDFHRPARSVSIESVAGSTFTPTIGRLEAFNDKGESLGFVRSRALFGESRQRMRLTFGDDVIAYALAYSDDNFENSTVFGGLDDLRYSISEAVAKTDADGFYEIDRLAPDEYDIIALTNPDIVFANPSESKPVSITRYENFIADFSVTVNSPPTIEVPSFSTKENPAVGSVIGTVVASDLNEGQEVTLSVPSDSPVSIDSETGELKVANSLAFDFETDPVITVTVIATDSVGGEARIEVPITLINVDEPPQVLTEAYSISEESDLDSAIGRVNAFDPELPDSPLSFVITGGSGAEAFSIEPTTGILRVTDPTAFDFENAQTLTLIVRVSDQSTPPVSTLAELTINILDANDAPVIQSESFDVAEDAIPGTTVGKVEFVEPDVNQTHSFRILSGALDTFRIESATGKISTLLPLDFATKSSYELLVQIVDSGTPPKASTQVITINVSDVDEPAKLVNDELTIAENAVAGTLIGTLVASDPDGPATLTIRSTDASNRTKLFGGRAVIDPATGKVTVAEGANLDADGDESVIEDRVLIFEGDDVVGEATVFLGLDNVNEAPTIPQQRLGVPLGLPSGRAFAEVDFVDPDGDSVTIEVLGDAAEQFGVDVRNRIFVLPGVDLDFEATPEFEVPVRITDAEGLTSTSTITVFQAPLPRFGTPLEPVTVNSGTELRYRLPVAFRAETVKSIQLIGPNNSLPLGLRFDPVIARLTGVAAPSVQGTFTFHVQVLQIDGDTEFLKEESFDITFNRSERPLFNQSNPFDVDGNGRVEPLDALRVINFLSKTGGGNANPLANTASFFTDTNGNNDVAPIDALLIINEISRRARAAVAESEGGFGAIDDSERNRTTHDEAIADLMHESSLF